MEIHMDKSLIGFAITNKLFAETDAKFTALGVEKIIRDEFAKKVAVFSFTAAQKRTALNVADTRAFEYLSKHENLDGFDVTDAVVAGIGVSEKLSR